MINYDELASYIIMKCNKDNKDISNKKLQKMVFYCQAYHIARYKEKLIDNEFEAWVHGAVLPVLYNDYSCYGYRNINIYNEEEYNNSRNNLGEYLSDFLDRIIDKFSSLSANEIEDLNHNELPWQEARTGYAANENCNEVISEECIYNYYSQLLYEEAKGCMENKKAKKISIKNKNLIMAKKRLAERKFFEINEDNKNEYYEAVFNDFSEGKGYTWRAMNGR